MSATLTNEQLDLLRSYADGPRIWDAASIRPDVSELLDRRLIRPSAHPLADELTDLGRQVLEANQ